MDMSENFFTGRVCQALEQTAQGSAGVTIPGSAQKLHGCGAWGHGSAGLVLGLRGVFFHLNHSVIPEMPFTAARVCIPCSKMLPGS